MNELDTAELAPLATAPEDAAGAAPNGERQSWAEKELLRLNRALRVLSACNRAVTASRHEAELLQEVCRIVLEVGGYSAVWVSYAEQDAARTVRPVAWAGGIGGYLGAWGSGVESKVWLLRHEGVTSYELRVTS